MFNILKLLINFLNIKEKKKLITFFFLNLINLFIELLILASIIPITQILLNIQVKIPFLGNLNFLNNYSYQDKAILAALTLILLFLIKVIFFTLYIYWQNSFAASVEFNFSKRLLKLYLNKKYTDLVNKNSGDITNKILFESQSFSSLLKNFLLLFTEILVFISIAIFLIIYRPFETILIVFFCIFAAITINLIQKKYSQNFGKQTFLYRTSTTDILIQTLKNILDIKLNNKKEFFLKKFDNKFSNTLKFRVKFESLSETPKQFFEIILVSSFGILVFLLVKNNEAGTIIIITSLFLTAFYRILPSISRITKSIQSINNSIYKFENIFSEFKYINEENTNKKINLVSYPNKINIINLNFSFNSKQKTLDNLNLEIKKGDKVGIMGVSGNGKTTLINILSGLIDEYSGEIYFDDKNFRDLLKSSWKKYVGYVPQFSNFLSDSIINNIAFGEEENKIDMKMLNQIVDICNIKEFSDQLPKGLETKLNEDGKNFSGGQLQRIAIARALYKKPSLLILDESTASIDLNNEKQILSKIFKLEYIQNIILISHKKASFELCNKIFIIENGSLYRVNE